MKRDKITPADRRRHIRIFKIFGPIMERVCKRKFNYVHDDLSGIEGPFLLLSNHTTNYDPILVGLAAKKQLYFVASEHITRNKFTGGLLRRYFNPILHLKGKQGVNTISNMLRTLKEGYSVAIFPEGNRSFNGLTCDFLPTIGKLARKSGAKLVTFRLEGGYLAHPRWGFTTRRGLVNGRLVHVYDTTELKGMTDDEVNEAIVRDLAEDAYATEARVRIPFVGKKPAYGLESTIFMCPKCKKLGDLKSNDTHLTCSCGYKAKFTEYGELEDENADKLTVTEIDTMQRALLESMVKGSQVNTASKDCGEVGSPIFTDEVTAELVENHNVKQRVKGTLRAFADHAEFNGRKFTTADLTGVAIYSRNTMVVHVGACDAARQYEIKGDEPCFNALKYRYLYEMLDGVQE